MIKIFCSRISRVLSAGDVRASVLEKRGDRCRESGVWSPPNRQVHFGERGSFQSGTGLFRLFLRRPRHCQHQMFRTQAVSNTHPWCWSWKYKNVSYGSANVLGG